MPLPNLTFENDPLIERPFHIVELGESFSSIAEASNGSFTALELAKWNKLDLTSLIHPGDTLYLFVSEIYAQNIMENMPLAIPIKFPTEVLSYSFLTTHTKIKDFSIENPDLQIDLSPPPLLKIGIPMKPMQGFSGPSFYFVPETKPIIVPPNETPATNPVTEESQKMNRTSWLNKGPWLMRATLILGFVLIPQSLGNSDIPLHNSQFADRLEENNKILVEYFPLVENNSFKKPKEGEYGYYVTYTKRAINQIHTTDKNGINISMYTTKTYVGRSRGYNSPRTIVKMRNYSHHKNEDPNYDKHGCLDKATRITTPNPEILILRHNDPGYQAIRGREQNIINDTGGSWSKVPNNDNEKTRSGNEISGIAEEHPYYSLWTNIARVLWGAVPFSYEVYCLP